MDASNSVGEFAKEGQLICNLDLLGPELTEDLRWIANFRPEAFTKLVEALSENNRAIESALLRRWRVRRC